MPNVSIVIPIAPYHTEVAKTAIRSGEGQTVPTTVIPVLDENSKGPSWARNRGLEQVDTEYVVFLDADDELARTFCERTLSRVEPDTYVFTDWTMGDRPVQAAEQPWCNLLRIWRADDTEAPYRPPSILTWHPITSLLPTEAVRAVGGFDESKIVGGEDAALYLELIAHGLCGVRLPEDLVQYTSGGRRGREFLSSGQYLHVFEDLKQKYRGTEMKCCGQGNSRNNPGSSRRLAGAREGYVLARAVFGGKRRIRGTATGTVYGPCGNGHPVWIDPRDVAKMPTMFQLVSPQPTPPSPLEPMSLREVAPFVARPSFPRVTTRVQPAELAPTKPDVATVIAMTKGALGA